MPARKTVKPSAALGLPATNLMIPSAGEMYKIKRTRQKNSILRTSKKKTDKNMNAIWPKKTINAYLRNFRISFLPLYAKYFSLAG